VRAPADAVGCGGTHWRLRSQAEAKTPLGDSIRGARLRVIETPGVAPFCNAVAVTSAGATVVVSDSLVFHRLTEFSVVDGAQLRVIGGAGDGPLRFNRPAQVWSTPDDVVFVADAGNSRVQVLTPTLEFHSVIGGDGLLASPVGVCANADVVVVSDDVLHCVSIFDRAGALLRRFGSRGSGDGQLDSPCSVCFMSGGRHVAVADLGNSRVSVFSVDGEFIRHVGVGLLKHPHGVACSEHDELVVADQGNCCVRVFSAAGELRTTFGDGDYRGVAIHGRTIFAQEFRLGVVLFT
jgi:DNA-binding beta-propeller fold protein YncE